MALNRTNEIRRVYENLERAKLFIQLAESFSVAEGSRKFELEAMAANELSTANAILKSLYGQF